VSAAAPTRCSFEGYLTAEVDSEEKHEWCDGVVYAMSRGTPEHARLSARVGRVLGNVLAAHGCEVYSAEAMIYVESARLSTYADVSVICGALETKSVKKNGRRIGEAITNPVVIVEVLSESTERYDRDGKFQAYKGLASLDEYVLVSQDEPRVEVYRRRPDGSWSGEMAERGGTVTIHGAPVAVDDVYGDPRRE
jgi:Uma2 family endonuclease